MIPIDYNAFRSFVYSKIRLLARDVEPSINLEHTCTTMDLFLVDPANKHSDLSSHYGVRMLGWLLVFGLLSGRMLDLCSRSHGFAT